MRIFNNNFFMNSFMPPMGMNPFMSGCCYNSFNPMFQFGMMNSLFSMPQMYSFSNYSMPMFPSMSMMPYTMPALAMGSNIFSMSNPAMTMPMINPMNFSLPAMLSEISLLNQTLSSFGNLTSKKFGNNNNVSQNTSTDKTFKNTGKLDKHFLAKTKQIAKKLNCDYKDLLALMNSESTLNPKSNNGSYVGLIQFGDAAIAELNKNGGYKNLTKQKILNMSAMEQLDLVEKYLTIVKNRKFSAGARLTAGDLYALVFAPGRANREILYSRGEAGYNSTNSKIDYDKDGKITKSEMAQRINQKRVDESIFA